MDYASFSPSGSFLDYNSTNNSTNNVKYKKKYARMKRLIKSMVFKNAAICDQVSLLQEKIMIAKEERRFLLKKLYHYQAVTDMENQLSSRVRGPGSSPPAATTVQDFLPVPAKKPPAKKPKPIDLLTEGLRALPAKNSKKSTPKQKKMVQPIPLDISGRPVFPIVLGGLTVHSIGEVVTDRPAYYTEDHIFPVGFCSTRVYGSLKNPEQKCIYTCKVLDGGSSPRFEIASDNDVDSPIRGNSANQCHAMLIQRINKAIGIEVVVTSGKGHEFFGFSVPTIQNLIQSSTGIRKCPGYRTIKFEVCRTGETIDASENDASLSYESLQRSIAFTRNHLANVVVKEEPQDTMNNSLRELLMTTP